MLDVAAIVSVFSARRLSTRSKRHTKLDVTLRENACEQFFRRKQEIFHSGTFCEALSPGHASQALAL